MDSTDDVSAKRRRLMSEKDSFISASDWIDKVPGGESELNKFKKCHDHPLQFEDLRCDLCSISNLCLLCFVANHLGHVMNATKVEEDNELTTNFVNTNTMPQRAFQSAIDQCTDTTSLDEYVRNVVLDSLSVSPCPSPTAITEGPIETAAVDIREEEDGPALPTSLAENMEMAIRVENEELPNNTRNTAENVETPETTSTSTAPSPDITEVAAAEPTHAVVEMEVVASDAQPSALSSTEIETGTEQLPSVADTRSTTAVPPAPTSTANAVAHNDIASENVNIAAASIAPKKSAANSCYVAFAYSNEESPALDQMSLGIGRVARYRSDPHQFLLQFMMMPERPEDILESRYSREPQECPEGEELLVHRDAIIALQGIKFNKVAADWYVLTENAKTAIRATALFDVLHKKGGNK